jgi:hypothetical protein
MVCLRSVPHFAIFIGNNSVITPGSRFRNFGPVLFPTPFAEASKLTKNIADSEVLSEVSQIVLKIDFVFVIGTTLFQFSLKITPDSRYWRE